MQIFGSLFMIGLAVGLAAGALSHRRMGTLTAIVGLYAVSLASVGFVGAWHDLEVIPYLVPWVLIPALGSLTGGGLVVLTRPGVIEALLGGAPPQPGDGLPTPAAATKECGTAA
jgi:hypothetical protein